MLLTITTTRAPATDLGYLLHKHPDRVQAFTLAAGTAHVFYPEASPERCTAALLLEVDPVGLVRDRKGGSGELAQYVNDRPYAASSLLAVALKEAFRTALTGRCDAKPELAASPIPLELHVPALRCRGGAALADRVFTPLGWRVEAKPVPFTPSFERAASYPIAWQTSANTNGLDTLMIENSTSVSPASTTAPLVAARQIPKRLDVTRVRAG